jgi:hypothetical protein
MLAMKTLGAIIMKLGFDTEREIENRDDRKSMMEILFCIRWQFPTCGGV